jgi:hypothetical protein
VIDCPRLSADWRQAKKYSGFLLSARSNSVLTATLQSIVVQATNQVKPNQQALYNLLAAYLQTVPLEELLESVERARREAQLRHIVLYGATCSYCHGRAKRLDARTYAVLRLS